MKVDKKTIKQHQEHWFREWLEKGQDALRDSCKKLRLESQTCPYCWYVHSKMGLAAFFDWECAICEKVDQAGSSYVPTICETCATKENRCKMCGDFMFEVKK